MLTSRSLNCIFSEIKIHFCLQKQLEYGKAIYVSGNISELGNWNISQSLRLEWNQQHYWTTTVLVPAYIYQNITFKYVIGQWDNPNEGDLEWQDGSNRKIDIENDQRFIVCNNKWNLEKITLHLCIEKCNENEEFYVVGNISELGRWKINNKMKKHAYNSREKVKKQNQDKLKIKNFFENNTVFSYTFYAFKRRENFQYLFVKKGLKIQAQRYPGRIFVFENNSNCPNRLATFYRNGSIQIFDRSSFNQLRISNITPTIFVGSYLMNCSDIQKLKDEGITDILSIQTPEDYSSHNLSIEYLQNLSQKQGIKYHHSDIKDKNPIDFIQKSLQAFEKMSKILKNNGKVYVHCSAGMYRSPQIIALYLILVQQYSIQSAIGIIKQRHPFAKPNYSVISSAIDEILNTYQKKIRKICL